MSNTRHIPRVTPKIISSPFTGEPVKPRVSDRRLGQEIYTEAVWICPASGRLFKKGVVDIKPVEQ